MLSGKKRDSKYINRIQYKRVGTTVKRLLPAIPEKGYYPHALLRQNAFVFRDPLVDLINPDSINYINNDKKKLKIIEDRLLLNMSENNILPAQRGKLYDEKVRLEKKISNDAVALARKWPAKKVIGVTAAAAGLLLL
jgi:hypothetical protein